MSIDFTCSQTPDYMAPEVIEGLSCSFSSDKASTWVVLTSSSTTVKKLLDEITDSVYLELLIELWLLFVLWVIVIFFYTCLREQKHSLGNFVHIVTKLLCIGMKRNPYTLLDQTPQFIPDLEGQDDTSYWFVDIRTVRNKWSVGNYYNNSTMFNFSRLRVQTPDSPEVIHGFSCTFALNWWSM